MRLGTIGALLGWLFIFLSVALLIPIAFSIYYDDGNWRFFVISSTIGLSLGGGLAWSCVTEPEIGHREGFAIVGFSWLAAAALGALPYYLSGAIPSYLNAYFESMSGFTTTGSTILERVEVLGPSLLFWRAFTQWLGGMGIIVLSLAILPILGIGGMKLFQAEMPGPTKDRLAPRIQDTARILWSVYVLFTAVETVLLMFAGMSFFDAICHAFSSLATGGFSTRTESLAAFHNPWIDIIIIVFIILAGINFSLHYRLLSGNLKVFAQSEELRFYLGIGIFATILVMFVNILFGTYDSWSDSLRYGAFQVWSMLTTTGFGTADFDQWAPLCKFTLVALMCLGGMAGSTSGGIKQVRILMFWKFTRMQITKLIHPKAVEAIKLDNQKVPAEVIQSILGYLSLYMVVFVVATMIITGQGIDLITGSTAVIATLNNIGPGLGGVGPCHNFAGLPDLSKAVLIICMVAGRLELYTIAVLFVPRYWKDVRYPRWRWNKA
ncbi:MAG: TrkH family potassium uptake protein [Thermodesulfobacteriota bacterium]|nr:MAG: TrkH family potassium uptake protein [Thermodesulfobacteriota bacterium]